MDRQKIYDGAIPQSTDILNTEVNAYIGLAKLSAAVLGTDTVVNGFTCYPSTPAAMNLNVSPGEIYSLAQIDPTDYAELPPNTHIILKQGVNLDPVVLTPTPPGTGGYSQNFLVQLAFAEIDTDSQVLPYYNATDPSDPYSGPGDSGLPDTTVRKDYVTISLKAGTAAPTGTQTTPLPDSGYVGAFVVTIANGQTTITSGNITAYSGTGAAVFITETLLQKLSQTTADARYAQQTQIQNNTFINCIDTGTADVLVASVTPALSGYVQGQSVKCKALNSNTGACTLNINGLGAKSIKLTNGGNPFASAIVAGGEYEFIYDGTNFQLMNPSVSPSVVTPVAIQNNAYISGNDIGTTNSYAVTLSPAVASYASGLAVRVKIANTNTGACVLNVNGLGNVNIKLNSGSSPLANMIVAGGEYEFMYDGTEFKLMNPSAIPLNNLQAANGYINFGNGLILQWGAAVIAVANTPTAVNLPIAFPNAVLGLTASTTSVNSVGGGYIILGNTSQIALFTNNNGGAISYFAIGN